MNDFHKVLKEISYNIYTAEGNPPKKVQDLICLNKFEISSDKLSEAINKYIDNGYFFLERLPCGRYIKSYRIDEICNRTLKALEGTLSSKIFSILESNPRALYIEFHRWLTTQHSNMMSSIIDEFWHQFITFSYEYKSWCMDNFGRFIHHIPTPIYEKNKISAHEVINDNATFFREYTKKYKLSENILFYSLPLRLYLNENKSIDDIFDIISHLASMETEQKEINTEKSKKNITYDTSHALDELNKQGYLILNKMTQREFCDFMEELGKIINISDIKINKLSNRKFNQSGSLDLHTDTPLADLVAWYCIVQDNDSGATDFIDSYCLIQKLSENEINILKTTNINFPIYKKFSIRSNPILEIDKDNNNKIYYTSWLKRSDYTDDQKKAIDKLEGLISDSDPISIKLEPGESLILDNRRMLHGRREVSENSLRYLYRVHVKLHNVEDN